MKRAFIILVFCIALVACERSFDITRQVGDNAVWMSFIPSNDYDTTFFIVQGTTPLAGTTDPLKTNGETVEVRVNGRLVRQEDIWPHILYIALYLILIVFSLAVNLILNPHDSNAVAATFTSLSNVGPSIGELGAVCNFGAEPVGAKLMYTLDMFLGRVEIYPVLAVAMLIFGKSSK